MELQANNAPVKKPLIFKTKDKQNYVKTHKYHLG